MSTAEGIAQATIRLALGRVAKHVRLFRNNNGEGWVGNAIEFAPDRSWVKIARFRRIRFGLFEGSGDLVGFTCVTITPEMVGTKIAVFTSIEVKPPSGGREEAEQIIWRDNVERAGGIAGVARTEKDAKAIIYGAPGIPS